MAWMREDRRHVHLSGVVIKVTSTGIFVRAENSELANRNDLSNDLLDCIRSNVVRSDPSFLYEDDTGIPATTLVTPRLELLSRVVTNVRKAPARRTA